MSIKTVEAEGSIQRILHAIDKELDILYVISNDLDNIRDKTQAETMKDHEITDDLNLLYSLKIVISNL